MIGFSHAAATDMPFAGMISVAMVCAAVVLGLVRGSGADVAEGVKDEDAIGLAPGQAGAQHAAPLQRLTALVLFGVFLGLAVLAKGPAAIILCGGGVFFWAIFTRRWRDAFRLLHPAAIVAFCVTALPWYVICARRNPDFFRIFIIEHNFKRYLTPEFQHVQPFWYYVPVLLVAFLPLVGLFLWSAAVGNKRSPSPPHGEPHHAATDLLVRLLHPVFLDFALKVARVHSPGLPGGRILGGPDFRLVGSPKSMVLPIVWASLGPRFAFLLLLGKRSFDREVLFPWRRWEHSVQF